MISPVDGLMTGKSWRGLDKSSHSSLICSFVTNREGLFSLRSMVRSVCPALKGK